MVSIWGELFLGIVKKQNVMARNTYMIAQGYSNHGQRKTGREEKRKGGSEGWMDGGGMEGRMDGQTDGQREIEDQEEALLKQILANSTEKMLRDSGSKDVRGSLGSRE